MEVVEALCVYGVGILEGAAEVASLSVGDPAAAVVVVDLLGSCRCAEDLHDVSGIRANQPGYDLQPANLSDM